MSKNTPPQPPQPGRGGCAIKKKTRSDRSWRRRGGVGQDIHTFYDRSYRSRSFICAALIAFLCCVACTALADEIRIAAASDLNFAIKEIIAGFEQKTGHTVRLTLGSSGNFYTQIVQGAPFHVYLSADLNYVNQLDKAGKTEPGSMFVYGTGRIVVWVPRNSPIHPQGLESLLDASVKRVAIANPEHAPYGRAAVAAMEKVNVYARIKPKLVLGESISQAAQFVQSGAAEIGIIALSLAESDTMKRSGRHWLVPNSLHAPIEQGAVLVKGAPPGARSFLDWLKGPQARSTLKRYGFQ